MKIKYISVWRVQNLFLKGRKGKVSYKIKNSSNPIGHSSISEYFSTTNENIYTKILAWKLSLQLIHNIPKPETAQIFKTGKWTNNMWYNGPVEYYSAVKEANYWYNQ